MTGWPRAYNERMAELGFSTYVFIERIAANAAALHPFPEHNVALVRDALADAGFDITLLGPEAPKVGDAQRLKNKAQRSLVWYLDEKEEDAIVFCGFSAPDLTGWTINWAGRMKKEELKKHILKVIKTPADANTPIVIEPESKPETARK